MSVDIVDLIKEPKMVKICAPMVRYSKLQFRTLVRKYDCDICFTPMIMADSFIQSAKARENEFSTSKHDKPLIVQFAAKEVDDFLCAAEMASQLVQRIARFMKIILLKLFCTYSNKLFRYANGVDLNCGCPQRWAMKEGYGAELLKKPQLVKDLIQQVRNRIPNPFTVSVKIRLLKDINKTIEMCRVLEKAGASFLTIHARTPEMRNEPIELENLKIVRDSVQLPLIANGDVKNLEDAEKLFRESKCEGIMSARGILANPALFSGHPTTPLSCVQDWLDITSIIPTSFLCFHHHLVFMLEKVLPKKSRLLFNNLQDRTAVVTFLEEYFNIRPSICAYYSKPIVCDFNIPFNRYMDKTDVNNDDDLSNNFLGNIFCDT